MKDKKYNIGADGMLKEVYAVFQVFDYNLQKIYLTKSTTTLAVFFSNFGNVFSSGLR